MKPGWLVLSICFEWLSLLLDLVARDGPILSVSRATACRLCHGRNKQDASAAVQADGVPQAPRHRLRVTGQQIVAGAGSVVQRAVAPLALASWCRSGECSAISHLWSSARVQPLCPSVARIDGRIGGRAGSSRRPEWAPAKAGYQSPVTDARCVPSTSYHGPADAPGTLAWPSPMGRLGWLLGSDSRPTTFCFCASRDQDRLGSEAGD